MGKKTIEKGVYTKGKYTFGKKGKPTKEYSVWLSMLTRCYSKRFLESNTTYAGCEVCDEWLDFQNFAEWFNENYIEGYQLDKDLIVKGNKLYSPETCCFVPQEINLLLVNRKNHRGKYPIGVSRDKTKMSAHIVIKAKQCYLGNYDTAEEAFNVYKKAKEANILSMAEEYKDRISEKVYNSLLKYIININD
jgi:hypothetical protein